MQQWTQATVQGWASIHIHQQAPAAKAAALQLHCFLMAAPRDMAKAAGNETGATWPEGLRVEHRLRE